MKQPAPIQPSLFDVEPPPPAPLPPKAVEPQEPVATWEPSLIEFMSWGKK